LKQKSSTFRRRSELTCDDVLFILCKHPLTSFSPSEINLSNNMSDGEDHRMQGADGVGFMGQTIDEDVEMETSRVERATKFGFDDRGRDAEAGNEEDEEDDDDDEEGEEESPNERKRKRAKVGAISSFIYIYTS